MKFDETLTTLVTQLLQSGSVPALMGEPGIGKSSFVEDLALSVDTQCFTVPVNQLAEKADLTGGRLVPTPDGKDFRQAFYPHEDISAAIDYAKNHPNENPILFLDEINRANSDLTSAVLTLVTSRKIGRARLPINLRMIVAGNDKGNITSLDDASISRFMLLPVEPDAATLIDILDNKGSLNRWVRKVLTTKPHLVFVKAQPTGVLADGAPADDDDDNAQAMQVADLFEADEAMVQFTTPRTIENVSRWLNLNDQDYDFLQAMLSTPVPDLSTMRPGSTGEIPYLQQVLEGFTGPTEFTDDLLSVIINDLMAGNAAPAAPAAFSVPRPDSYVQLKQQTTRTDLEQLVNTLPDAEKNAVFLYALHEKADNAALLGVLDSTLDTVEPTAMQTLFSMLGAGAFHEPNVKALSDLNGPVAQRCNPIIQSLV